MNELLGALGLAWPRLLLYPGGLFALLAGRLLGVWLAHCGCVPTRSAQSGLAELAAVVPPLAALSLMPLTPARSFPYGLDLVVALALLAWPQALAGAPMRRTELTRAYGPLLVAVLGTTVALGGLELTRLLRLPEPWVQRALLGCATALWLVSMPRLLAGASHGTASELRALGLLLIAALPVLGALAAATAERLPQGSGWMLAAVALLAVSLALGGVMRLSERVRGAGELGLGVAVIALVGLALWAA